MSKIRHNDILIPTDGTDPFVNCKLDRKKYAEVLTDIVSGYADGFVLAINNPWGEGKTTFVKMWRQQLENSDFKTLYFNAWENDFEQDVLVALISELAEIKNKPVDTFNKVLDKAVSLTNKVLPAIAKHLAKKAIGDEAAEAIIEGVAEYGAEELKEQINSYTSRKKSIQDFKENLEVFVNEVDADKPVVFIIDELDRCRPNYAVEVLEQIKHLFSVPGIVFVLSIDKEQLGHAIRGVYGSDKIDADEYLRRFIDLEYSIPMVDVNLYILYLFEYFQFDEFLNSSKRQQCSELRSDRENFKILSQLLFSNKSFTLRQIEKAFSKIRLTLRCFNHDNYIFPEVIVFISYLSVLRPDILGKLRNRNYSLQSLVDDLEFILLPLSDEKNKRRIIALFCSFLTRFSNDNSQGYARNDNNLLRKKEVSNEFELGFKSKLEDENNNVLNMIDFYSRSHEAYGIGLNFILNKFDLTDKIQS